MVADQDSNKITAACECGTCYYFCEKPFEEGKGPITKKSIDLLSDGWMTRKDITIYRALHTCYTRHTGEELEKCIAKLPGVESMCDHYEELRALYDMEKLLTACENVMQVSKN